jgi:hypothetical protein
VDKELGLEYPMIAFMISMVSYNMFGEVGRYGKTEPLYESKRGAILSTR